MAIKTAPYGTWESPIKPDDFAVGHVDFASVHVNRSNGKIYFLENRPDEDGRAVIIEYDDKKSRDVLPKAYNALSQVHEYGGGSWIVRQLDGHLIFTDFKTKGVYVLDPETGHVNAITPEDDKIYFADFDCHPKDTKWVLAIKEDHHGPTIDSTTNTLVAIDTSNKQTRTIAEGCDFYSYPRFSRDGKQVCCMWQNSMSAPALS